MQIWHKVLDAECSGIACALELKYGPALGPRFAKVWRANVASQERKSGQTN
jgi:hypothetical protein